LCGTTSSGLYEALLAKKYFHGDNSEIHVFSPAYLPHHFDELLDTADHFVVNSATEWARYKAQLLSRGKSVSLRINPELSTQTHTIYDPCAPKSRFGVKLSDFDPSIFEGITGLHFHTLCEQGFDALKATADKFLSDFGKFIVLLGIKTLNFGGGHHITKDGYDIDGLTAYIKSVRAEYGVDVYLEPGEAVALNSGYLVSTVLELFHNDGEIAILDTSAACHAPDIIEMPYTPPVIYPTVADKGYEYRLAGNTCLAGDIIGDYVFDTPLSARNRIVFGDMAIYSMVKNNTFNGVPLPDILLWDGERVTVAKEFGFVDFEGRL
jgi:carboxynorspermidine decarboxylase